MLYPFLSLQTAGWLVGAGLVILHLFALLNTNAVKGWLRALPRSAVMGQIFLTVDAGWAFALVATMDLGEFSHWRTPLLILIPVAYVLTLQYVDEFLAVRALGILGLLAAEPILEAAFLRAPESRLLLVVLAYTWIVLGMFWVGMPYVLRDQISWALRSEARWKTLCLAGLAYGIAVLICSATLYRSA